jgi:dienelactone hydrolase
MNQKCIRLCVFTALASLICAAGAQHAAAQSPLVGADTPLRADLNEAVHFIPVTVTGLHGLTRSGLFIVTSYHPSGTGPFPAIVYSHGRMVSDADRAKPLRKTEHDIAAFWVRRGFAFFIPTRLGYGATGVEPDIEEVGGCDGADYGPAAQVTLTQVLATIKFAQSQAFVDPNRTVLIGNSAGGLAMIIASGTSLPSGIVMLLNFAGGAGGGVKGVGIPCNERNIRLLITQAGKTARLPMLWIYASNDRFWGADLPVK